MVKDRPLKGVVLTCDPDGGVHPTPAAACELLRKVDGDPAKLNVVPNPGVHRRVRAAHRPGERQVARPDGQVGPLLPQLLPDEGGGRSGLHPLMACRGGWASGRLPFGLGASTRLWR